MAQHSSHTQRRKELGDCRGLSLPVFGCARALPNESADRSTSAIAPTPQLPSFRSLGLGTPHATAARGAETPDQLVATIEGEVIPRLLMALKSSAADAEAANPALVPTADQVRELALLAIGDDDMSSALYVERLYLRGMALETIHLELLAPAARRLNHLWSEDICDFGDVTIGLARLHAIVRSLSADFRSRTVRGGSGAFASMPSLAPSPRRALIAAIPGEQHTFGALIVEDFFCRAGWEVCGWPVTADVDLERMVKRQSYDLVGLSIGCNEALATVSTAIRHLRRASKNTRLVIMVGGSPFIHDTSLATKLGADGTGIDGAAAVAAANAALDKLRERV